MWDIPKPISKSSPGFHLLGPNFSFSVIFSGQSINLIPLYAPHRSLLVDSPLLSFHPSAPVYFSVLNSFPPLAHGQILVLAPPRPYGAGSPARATVPLFLFASPAPGAGPSLNLLYCLPGCSGSLSISPQRHSQLAVILVLALNPLKLICLP